MIDPSLFEILARRVFAFPSSDRLFNPYCDVNLDVDRPEGAEVRRSNLLHYLAACSKRPDILIIAEAPGPNGCRFSGVPFTSEEEMLSGRLPFAGQRSSLGEKPKSEYSSRIVWGMLAEVFPRIVIWSTVPLHPHRPGEVMSIRTPSASEIRVWSDLIPAFVDYYEPKMIASVGRIAEKACDAHGIQCSYVRHPSQGGANLFRDGMKRLLTATSSG